MTDQKYSPRLRIGFGGQVLQLTAKGEVAAGEHAIEEYFSRVCVSRRMALGTP